jgi:type 1 glutamine amidotransferase
MSHKLRLGLFLFVIAVGNAAGDETAAHRPAPLKALLITGGCCHDYVAQEKILTEGLTARVNIAWTVCHEADGDQKTHRFSVYETNNWAKPFDVIVHNECSGMVTNVAFVESIARAHTEGVPAVVIHCSIHSYRMAETDAWRKVLGVSSYRHQAKRAFDVVNLKPEHPVMRDFPLKWHNHPDELYEIKKVWPNCIPLAASLTPGKENDQHPSVWVNQEGRARVFGTTLGHSVETMSEKVYLDLVARGLLWACGKLNEEGKPKPGYGPR